MIEQTVRETLPEGFQRRSFFGARHRGYDRLRPEMRHDCAGLISFEPLRTLPEWERHLETLSPPSHVELGLDASERYGRESKVLLHRKL